MEIIIKKIEEIKKWIDINKTLPDFSDNNDYMRFAVEIGNHVRYLMLVAASLRSENQRGYNKEDAVIAGLFVRLCKLYDTLCFNVARNQGEIVKIFIRLIFETSIKIEYLISSGRESIESFVFVSYKAIKEIYEDLQGKKKTRELIGIENRILFNIEQQFKEDDIDIDTLLKNRNWKLDGKTFKEILNDMDIQIMYSYIFSRGSSYVHGDWLDLRANHLVYENGMYLPQLEHDRVDPRYISPMSVACLRALCKFLEWNKSDPDEFIISTSKDLETLLRKFDADHEEALQKDNYL